MEATIEFLLQNALGLENAVATDRILDHLESVDLKISREGWQQEVLGPLRDHEIWVASTLGPPGMFIIRTRDDAEAVHGAYAGRVRKLLQRLQILENQIRESGWPLDPN